MAEKKQGKFIGNGRMQHFQNGGKVLKCSIALHKINNADIISGTDKNGDVTKYLPFVVSENKEGEDEWKNTHYIKLDQWKLDNPPKKQKEDSSLPY